MVSTTAAQGEVPAPDSTLAPLREAYEFIPRRCRR